MACDNIAHSAVELSPALAVLKSDPLSSRLEESSRGGSKCDPVDGIRSFEIVVLGLKGFLPSGHIVPPSIFPDIRVTEVRHGAWVREDATSA